MSNKKYNIAAIKALFKSNFESENIIQELHKFPNVVVDEYFQSAKLTKPSGANDREIADLIRLSLIAFAGDGTIPAGFRGKRLPRFFRNSSTDEDLVGVLTISNQELEIEFLSDLAKRLSIKKLIIESQKSLDNYFADPFEVEDIVISRNLKICDNFSKLPKNLISLATFSPSFISTNDIARLSQVRNLNLQILSGEKFDDAKNYSLLDLSKNINIEDLRIEIITTSSQTASRVFSPWILKGVGNCKNVKNIEITCNQPFGIQEDYRAEIEPFDLEAMPKLSSLNLRSVHYNSAIQSKGNKLGIQFSDVIGVEKIVISNDLNSQPSFSIRDCNQLSIVEACGGICNADISGCRNLKTISIEADKLNSLTLAGLPMLNDCALNCREIQCINIFRTGLTSIPKSNTPVRGLKKSPFGNSSSFILINNWNLKSLDGLEKFIELEEIEFRVELNESRGDTPDTIGHSSMQGFFIESSTANQTLTKMIFSGCNMKSLVGLSYFRGLKELVISGRFDSLEGIEGLNELASLDLSGSVNLLNLKPLSNLKKLELLKLKDCKALSPQPSRVNLQGNEIAEEISRYA